MQADDIKMKYDFLKNRNASSKANDACLTDSGAAFFTNSYE